MGNEIKNYKLLAEQIRKNMDDNTEKAFILFEELATSMIDRSSDEYIKDALAKVLDVKEKIKISSLTAGALEEDDLDFDKKLIIEAVAEVLAIRDN